MEGSRKRATAGKVDGGKETGGHSKDKKSRNQHEHHELNKADMTGAGASDGEDMEVMAIIDRLIDDAEKRSRDCVDAITRRLNVACKLSSEYVDRITDGRMDIGDKEKQGHNNIVVPLLKEAETFIAKCKTSTSEIPHKCNVKSCVLVGNKTLLDNLQSVGALGTFLCDDINIRGPTDHGGCHVSCLLALADGRLLLSDLHNKNIKLFDVNHKLVSHVPLQSIPYDIAEIDGGQVAVCLTGKKEIQFVSVSSILTLRQIIKTAVKCWSMTRCGNNLAAVSWGSRYIVEIDMRGRYVRTVWICPYGNLGYIRHNTRGELITIGDHSAVTRVTRDGVVLARYKGNKSLLGLTVHPDGSIYVCDYGSDNIDHITADCTRSIHVFGDGQITKPQCICYNQHHNSLYVSRGDNNWIKVFCLGY